MSAQAPPESPESTPPQSPSPPPNFVSPADQKAMQKRAEMKKKMMAFFITESDAQGMKIRESTLQPKAVDLRPRSPAQFILYEVPLLIHLPFFLLVNLTTTQFWQLIQSAVITFIVSLICIHLINKAEVSSKRLGIAIFVILFVIINGFLISQILMMTDGWLLTNYPVFDRLFS